TPINEVFRWEELASSRRGDFGFRMTNSFEEAQELMKNGWDTMAKKIEAKLQAKKSEVSYTTTRRSHYDVAGFQASVPRYLQGIPTSMINQKQVVKKQKVVTLVKSISYHAGITTEQIMENSIKAMQVVKKVEAQGYRVNLDIVFAGQCYTDRERILCKIRIKSANEKLNVSKMAFPLVHPSMLRRMLFRFIETCPDMKDKAWTGGYGRPIYESSTIERCLKETDYLLPSFIEDVDATVEAIGLK